MAHRSLAEISADLLRIAATVDNEQVKQRLQSLMERVNSAMQSPQDPQTYSQLVKDLQHMTSELNSLAQSNPDAEVKVFDTDTGKSMKMKSREFQELSKKDPYRYESTGF